MAPDPAPGVPGEDAGYLWATGGFSLSDVLGGRADCPPAVQTVVVVAWRPPPRPRPPEPDIPDAPVQRGRVLARRVSDFTRPGPDVAEDEAILRMAWERAIAVLRPVAALRIGPLDLAFAAGDGADVACPGLHDQLRAMGGDWRLGYARLPAGFGSAMRALELWVLDASEPGSWLVDVTDLT